MLPPFIILSSDTDPLHPVATPSSSRSLRSISTSDMNQDRSQPDSNTHRDKDQESGIDLSQSPLSSHGSRLESFEDPRLAVAFLELGSQGALSG